MSLLNQVLRDLDARANQNEACDLRRAADPEPIPAGSLPIEAERDWTRIVAWILVAGALLVWIGVMWVLPAVRSATVQPVIEIKAVQPFAAAANSAGSTPSRSTSAEPKPVMAPVKTEVAKAPMVVKQESVAREQKTDQSIDESKVQPKPKSPVVSPVAQTPPVSASATSDIAMPATPEPTTKAANRAYPLTESQVKLSRGTATQPPKPETVPEPRPDNASSPQTEPVVSATKRIEIARSSAKVEDIERLINRGELSRAELLLNQRLQQQPDDREAHRLRVGLLLRGGRTQQALNQIDSAQQRFGHIPALELIAARVLIELNDKVGAEKRLRDLLIKTPDERDATRMLAALWHAQSRSDEAAALYQRLVALPGANQRDWLGLALSTDGVDNSTALDAYRQAASGQGLDAATLRYVQQRIRELKE